MTTEAKIVANPIFQRGNPPVSSSSRGLLTKSSSSSRSLTRSRSNSQFMAERVIELANRMDILQPVKSSSDDATVPSSSSEIQNNLRSKNGLNLPHLPSLPLFSISHSSDDSASSESPRRAKKQNDNVSSKDSPEQVSDT